jgi:hypothetical protein
MSNALDGSGELFAMSASDAVALAMREFEVDGGRFSCAFFLEVDDCRFV